MSDKRDHYEGIGPCIDHGKSKNLHYLGYANARFEGQKTSLHRLVYAQHNGVKLSSMKGLDVRHRCDNPRCINPDHLLLGTRRENMMDCIERDRNSQGERHGEAKLTEEIVRYCRKNYTPRHREFGAAALARKYGVTPQTIFYLLCRHTWAHVKESDDE